MVDTLALGAGSRKAVEVRVLFPAPPHQADLRYDVPHAALSSCTVRLIFLLSFHVYASSYLL